MKLAIIPARGGSKRIPGKNIRDFCGMPMISYAIKSAQNCGLFDEVVVSTDCDKIGSVAESYGATVPFKRPPNLSDDHTGTGVVIKHAIRWWQENKCYPLYVCCIYPTSPLLLPDDLKNSFQCLAGSQDKDYVFSVSRYTYPVHRSLLLNANEQLEMLFPEHMATRSQDLPDVFHDAGQFYWGKTDAFLNDLPMFSHHSIPYLMPRQRVMDIDDEEDWLEAEVMYRFLEEKKITHNARGQTE